ncbi:MAG: hypothetical protein ACFB9M_08630 [Myxococcota bacterium]
MMEPKPKIRRRKNCSPDTARTCSQQVKVSPRDRAAITALARLDGVTPSTWCYQAVMRAVEAERHRLFATDAQREDRSRETARASSPPTRPDATDDLVALAQKARQATKPNSSEPPYPLI